MLKVSEIQPKTNVANVVVGISRIECITERAEEMGGVALRYVPFRIEPPRPRPRDGLPVGDRSARRAVAVAAVGPSTQHHPVLIFNFLGGVQSKCLVASTHPQTRHLASDFSAHH